MPLMRNTWTSRVFKELLSALIVVIAIGVVLSLEFGF
jgi:hypothetical protein